MMGTSNNRCSNKKAMVPWHLHKGMPEAEIRMCKSSPLVGGPNTRSGTRLFCFVTFPTALGHSMLGLVVPEIH